MCDLGIKPSVSMRRILYMVFQKKPDIIDQTLCPWGRVIQPLFPVVKAAPADVHGFTEQAHRELSGQFKDHLVFLLSYCMTVPSPFTS